MNCCSPEEKLTIQCTAIIPGIGSFYWNAISSSTGGQGPKTPFHTPTHMHGLSNVHFHILWLMQVKESCASDLKGKAFAFFSRSVCLCPWVCPSFPPSDHKSIYWRFKSALLSPISASLCIKSAYSVLKTALSNLRSQDLVFYRTCLYQGPSKSQICVSATKKRYMIMKL